MRLPIGLTDTSGFLSLGFAGLLLSILVVAFLSRPYVFCQYLRTMTGITLHPPEVRRTFRAQGKEGVRALFLDLIVREDLKAGPLPIPEEGPSPESGG